MLIAIVKSIYNWYKIDTNQIPFTSRYSIHKSLRCDRD
jgi:hypothetical protein